jgi:hypothetical protein
MTASSQIMKTHHRLQIIFHDVLISIAVFHHIFQFLNYIDVGNIDNAFNNKEIRKLYLKHIKKSFPDLNYLSIGSLSVGSLYDVNFFSMNKSYCIRFSFIKWMISRGIYLQHVWLNCSNTVAFGKQKLGQKKKKKLLEDNKNTIVNFSKFYRNANEFGNTGNTQNTLISLLYQGSNESFKILIGSFRSFQNLKNIDFTLCSEINDTSLILLSENCPRLESIILPKTEKGMISTVSLSQIATKCPNIHSVSVCGTERCRNVIQSFKDCLSITSLVFDDIRHEYFYDGTSLLQLLLSGFKKLQTLHLLGISFEYKQELLECRFDHFLELLVQNCQCLDDLSFDNSNVTDQTVLIIAINCLNLSKLSLDYCKRVTDESIILVIFRCRKLRYLSLSDVSDITDQTVMRIATYSSQLEYLSLRNNNKIGTEMYMSIAILGKRCPSLTYLNLNGWCCPRRDIILMNLVYLSHYYPRIKVDIEDTELDRSFEDTKLLNDVKSMISELLNDLKSIDEQCDKIMKRENI